MLGQPYFQKPIALLQVSDALFAHRCGGRRIEERRIALVYLGIDVRQHLLEAVPVAGSRGRREAGVRAAIGQILDDRRPFSEHLPIIELQRRHVSFRVDAPVGRAVADRSAREVHLFELQIETRFAGYDVWREGAGTGGVKQLHVDSLLMAASGVHLTHLQLLLYSGLQVVSAKIALTTWATAHQSVTNGRDTHGTQDAKKCSTSAARGLPDGHLHEIARRGLDSGSGLAIEWRPAALRRATQGYRAHFPQDAELPLARSRGEGRRAAY